MQKPRHLLNLLVGKNWVQEAMPRCFGSLNGLREEVFENLLRLLQRCNKLCKQTMQSEFVACDILPSSKLTQLTRVSPLRNRKYIFIPGATFHPAMLVDPKECNDPIRVSQLRHMNELPGVRIKSDRDSGPMLDWDPVGEICRRTQVDQKEHEKRVGTWTCMKTRQPYHQGPWVVSIFYQIQGGDRPKAGLPAF